MATEAATQLFVTRSATLCEGISIGYFDGEPSRRIVEMGFHKLGVAHEAVTRCLDGTKLDRTIIS